jgi:hypothetical protein
MARQSLCWWVQALLSPSEGLVQVLVALFRHHKADQS